MACIPAVCELPSRSRLATMAHPAVSPNSVRGVCGSCRPRAPLPRLRRAPQTRKHAARRPPPPTAAAGGGAGPLIDPAAGGKRQVFVPQKLDPSRLEDMRKAEACGPRGLLLIGMSEADCAAVRSWFGAMEPDFAVSACPARLQAEGTLRQAVQPGGKGTPLPLLEYEPQPVDAPPVAFFSGMTGEEQIAVMEMWQEQAGFPPPAFASVTPAILDKLLSRLLADIVRAQAQQPPPGFDPELVAEVNAVAAAGPSSSSSSPPTSESGGSSLGAAVGTAAGAASGGSRAAGAGGETALRSKLQDYVMLDGQGQTQGAPMSLDALKEQIQQKMAAKREAQAAADKAARREESQDETDRLRSALRKGGKKGGGQKGGGKGGGKPAQGGGGKGFGG